MQIVKKITVAAGQAAATTVKMLAANNGQPLFCGRLIGIATGTKSGTSQYGDWNSLIGNFAKTDREGVITQAPQAFAPDIVLMPVVAALALNTGPVEIAVDVYAHLDEKSPVGFSYYIEQVIPDAPESPMARLMAAAGAAKPLQLAAPAAPAAKGAKK